MEEDYKMDGWVPISEPNLTWEDLKKNHDGMVPVIVQDDANGQVLMLAYMDEKAYETTLRTGRMTYYSRSRQELWIKGLTSGHFQYVKSLTADCDYDTLLARVNQIGAACHTGSRSCFFHPIEDASQAGQDDRNISINPQAATETIQNVSLTHDSREGMMEDEISQESIIPVDDDKTANTQGGLDTGKAADTQGAVDTWDLADVSVSEAEEAYDPFDLGDTEKQDTSADENKVPHRKRTIEITAMVLVICAMLIVFAASVIRIHSSNQAIKNVAWQDYLSVTFEGYDGYGDVVVDFYQDTYAKALAKAAGLLNKVDTAATGEELQEQIRAASEDLYTLAYGQEEPYTISGIPDSGYVSNEDEIEVDFSWDDALAQQLGITVSREPEQLTVDGLEPTTDLDLFADISVQAVYPPPYSVEVVNDSAIPFVQNLGFSVSYDEPLEDGSTVYVTAVSLALGATSEETIAHDYGYIITSDYRKDYTISIEAYLSVEDASELTDEALAVMLQQADDLMVLDDEFQQAVAYGYSVSMTTFTGWAIFFSDSAFVENPHNGVVLIYENTLSKKSTGEYTVYRPVVFEDIYVKEGTTQIQTSELQGYTYDSFGIRLDDNAPVPGVLDMDAFTAELLFPVCTYDTWEFFMVDTTDISE